MKARRGSGTAIKVGDGTLISASALRSTGTSIAVALQACTASISSDPVRRQNVKLPGTELFIGQTACTRASFDPTTVETDAPKISRMRATGIAGPSMACTDTMLFAPILATQSRNEMEC